MCEFCEKKFNEHNLAFEVKELSERKESKYNEGYYTGIQAYVDIEDSPPQNNNQAVWYLGESLKKLAQADVFIGIKGSWCWNGCHI